MPFLPANGVDQLTASTGAHYVTSFPFVKGIEKTLHFFHFFDLLVK